MLGFIFINLDNDAAPVAEFWPGVEAHSLNLCPDILTYWLAHETTAVPPVDVEANWKIQVDNYLECQNCRHGHECFADMLDIANQSCSLGKNQAYNFIPSAAKAENKAHPLDPKHCVMDQRPVMH
ncbi:MAG: hypothetical protein AB3N11_04690 [Arenibacterium sp.]